MKQYRKIVSDSSCNLLAAPGQAFAVAPLHIVTAAHDYRDDASLDVGAMVHTLRHYKGKSSTACPGVGEWLATFEGATEVFAVTMTGALSGSNNAARCAAAEYEHKNPGSRVCVVDSLSAGPQQTMLVQKLLCLAESEWSFEEIACQIEEYRRNTGLLFVLASIKNLANNGRAGKVQAEAVGLLGMRLLGRASKEGTLELISKTRGESTALAKTVQALREDGWRRGAVWVHHCGNPAGADALRAALQQVSPESEIRIGQTRGLCSYYAEAGGLMIGYERA